MVILPMFPLGGVLVPGAIMPLHVFEPRYRTMLDDCLDRDGRFGVVLIERGSEVGGGDQRSDLGTIASIRDYQRFDDGRSAVVAVGEERLRVTEWLADDPYPRASIEPWPDERSDPGDPALLEQARDAVAALLSPDRSMPELDADPSLASHQLTALAPVGAYDRWRLLAEPGPSARLRRLVDLLDDHPGATDPGPG